MHHVFFFHLQDEGTKKLKRVGPSYMYTYHIVAQDMCQFNCGSPNYFIFGPEANDFLKIPWLLFRIFQQYFGIYVPLFLMFV